CVSQGREAPGATGVPADPFAAHASRGRPRRRGDGRRRRPMHMKRAARCVAALGVAGAGLAHAQAIADSWSPLVRWQQPNGFEVTPIHIGLLPNGKLFFVNEYNYMQHPEVDLNNRSLNVEFMFTMQATPAFAATPASVAIQPMANP